MCCSAQPGLEKNHVFPEVQAGGGGELGAGNRGMGNRLEFQGQTTRDLERWERTDKAVRAWK